MLPNLQSDAKPAADLNEEDDISSEEEEVDSDDVDSDDLAEELMEHDNDADDVGISKQQDFIQF